MLSGMKLTFNLVRVFILDVYTLNYAKAQI